MTINNKNYEFTYANNMHKFKFLINNLNCHIVTKNKNNTYSEIENLQNIDYFDDEVIDNTTKYKIRIV